MSIFRVRDLGGGWFSVSESGGCLLPLIGIALVVAIPVGVIWLGPLYLGQWLWQLDSGTPHRDPFAEYSWAFWLAGVASLMALSALILVVIGLVRRNSSDGSKGIVVLTLGVAAFIGACLLWFGVVPSTAARAETEYRNNPPEVGVDGPECARVAVRPPSGDVPSITATATKSPRVAGATKQSDLCDTVNLYSGRTRTGQATDAGSFFEPGGSGLGIVNIPDAIVVPFGVVAPDGTPIRQGLRAYRSADGSTLWEYRCPAILSSASIGGKSTSYPPTTDLRKTNKVVAVCSAKGSSGLMTDQPEVVLDPATGQPVV